MESLNRVSTPLIRNQWVKGNVVYVMVGMCMYNIKINCKYYFLGFDLKALVMVGVVGMD